MKKSRIIIFVLLNTIILAGCTNNVDKQLQQQNDLLRQQNTLLQQETDPPDTNINPPGYVKENTDITNDAIITGNTKTIPFDAVGPANNNNNYPNNEFID